MNKFSLDYGKLEQKLEKKKSYLLSEVEDRIEKVAWDVVRFRDNKDTEMLWKIQDSPEGPVIVALYDEDTGALKVLGDVKSAASDWSIIKQADNVHVFYKDEPVTVLRSENTGIPKDEIGLMTRWLPTKLASDEEYQAYVLSLSGDIGSFQKNYPELHKVASKAQALKAGATLSERKDLSKIADLITGHSNE